MHHFFHFYPQEQNHFQIQNPTLPIAPTFSEEDLITASIEKNIHVFKSNFHYPLSSDFVIRSFSITINQKKITKQSYLWKPGMSGWQTAENIPEVLKLVALCPPPLPPNC